MDRQTGSGQEKVSQPLAARIFVSVGFWEIDNGRLMFTVYGNYCLLRFYRLVYRGFYDQTMMGKKVANIMVNGKLPLTIGNPIFVL